MSIPQSVIDRISELRGRLHELPPLNCVELAPHTRKPAERGGGPYHPGYLRSVLSGRDVPVHPDGLLDEIDAAIDRARAAKRTDLSRPVEDRYHRGFPIGE